MNKLLVFSAGLISLGSLIYVLDPLSAEKVKYKPRTSEVNASYSWAGANAYYNLIRSNPATGEVSVNDILNSREEVSNLAFYKTNANLLWEEIGPDNYGGRTRAILVDKTVTDGSRVYAGGVSGGLFVSNNRGGNWSPVNDGAQSLIVSTLAQSPDGTIWFGTGSTFDNPSGTGGSGFLGSGLFKLSPGSNSITQITSASPTPNQPSAEWTEINAVRVNQNTGRIYVGQNRGLRISDDGGNSWINPVKTGTGSAVTSGAMDLELADDGTILAVLGGRLYRSATGNDNTFDLLGVNEGIAGSSQRMEVSISAADNNYAYAVTVNNGNFSGLYKSTDKGANWSKVPALTSFNPFCCNAQGFYDLVCSADPDNANTVYIGGVDVYRYDGNFTKLSAWNQGQFEGYFVHADQHSTAFFSGGTEEMYFGNDGGIFKTFSDGADFRPYNRGYNVTQFYSVAMDHDNHVMGGTQDNGTIEVDGVGYYPKEGIDKSGGDGFDCDYSNITDNWFATVYYGDVRKNGGSLCGPWGNCTQENSDANFNTKIKLWESHEDPTSMDSIEYIVENGTTEYPLVEGNGTKKTFTGIVPKNQPFAKFYAGTIIIYAGPAILTDVDGDGNFAGAGTGTFNYTTGEYSVTFNTAPANKLLIKAKYSLHFNTGDVLALESNTPGVQLKGNDFRVYYTAPTSIGPGSVIKVKDPVQSLLAFGASTGKIYILRGALKGDGKWMILNMPQGGPIGALEFSKDGNHLFVGTSNGDLMRISGLNTAYDSTAVITTTGQLTATKIFDAPGVITGLGIDPKNANNVLVTIGGYGLTNNVYISNSALTATSSSNSFSSIQGNLPNMPVYDGIISNDPNKTIVIGTEYGVYTSTFSDPSSWSDANSGLPRVPVFAVRQQTNPWVVSNNDGVIYLGTHGRGMWKTGSLLSIKKDGIKIPLFNSELTVYPNPVNTSNTINVKLFMGKSTKASAYIYDINGKQVLNRNINLVYGENKISFPNQLSEGNYFMVIESEGKSKVAKFIVTR